MAEQSTDVASSPEIISKPRRNSMGKVSSSNNEEKVIPQYLRASTGSCHDFCKYGRKHAFEAKERRPIPKRTTKAPIEDQSSKQSTILPQREKKTSVVKPKPTPIAKNHFSDVPEIIKREISSKVKDVPKVFNSDGPKSSVSEVKKTSVVKPRSPPNLKARLSESPKLNKQEVSSSSEKKEVSMKQASPLTAKATKASTKNAVSRKPKPAVQKPLSSPDTLGGSNGGGVKNKIKITKTVGPSKLAVKNVVASTLLSSSAKSSLRRVPSLNARKHVKVAPTLKNQGKIKKTETKKPKSEVKHDNKDLVQEKTLYVVAMETGNKGLAVDQNESSTVELSPLPKSSLSDESLTSTCSSLQNEENEDQGKSEYTETETEDDYESEYEETGGEISGDEHLGKPRKNSVVHSEEKDPVAVKLCFRRGKVIDLQSDNNSPRRLRFRRGRLVGGNQCVKSDGRRTFKKREAESEMNDEKPGSEKVVLRHQDVQGKKEAQILFNNVIEQTASKLVETRKSKVKALVGAFETVISLQESKPSANTVS